MSTFSVGVEIGQTMEGSFERLDALVDTGAFYTWVPGRILRELGLQPSEQIEFTMANGEPQTRDAVEAVVRLDGRLRRTICVFGKDDDLVLLGAYTLEGFGLMADPINKRLVPAETMPAASGGRE